MEAAQSIKACRPGEEDKPELKASPGVQEEGNWRDPESDVVDGGRQAADLNISLLVYWDFQNLLQGLQRTIRKKK